MVDDTDRRAAKGAVMDPTRPAILTHPVGDAAIRDEANRWLPSTATILAHRRRELAGRRELTRP